MRLSWKFLHKHSVGYCAATTLAAMLFFALTDPAHLSPVWLMVGFALAVGVIYWLARASVALSALYVPRVAAHARRLVRLLTLCGAVLVALQSAGQLTYKDLAILIPLAALGYFYVSYGKAAKTTRR